MTNESLGAPAFNVLRFTTGSEQEEAIIKHRDDFFNSVLLGLGFKEDWLARIPATVIERDLGREQPGSFEPTDDRLHYLVLQNEVLAMVLDRRNDGNYHEVTFWSRPASNLAAEHIGEMVNWQNTHSLES
jgi:hypothetical protein